MKLTKLFFGIFLFILFPCVVFGFGNQELPEVPPVTSGELYFSPNGDGVKDMAELEFTATVNVKSKEGYIPEYSLTIYDENDNVVKKVVKTEKSDIDWFSQIFTGYTQHQLTKSIEWDGLNTDGRLMPDGTYRVELTVIAASKKATSIDLDNFYLDTKAPQAQISPDSAFSTYKAFSPNNDGQKDLFIIKQSGGTEALWKGEILNSSGNIVYSYEFTDQAPEDFSWDGRDNNGQEAADGVYSYKLYSTDEAGNNSEIYEIKDISLDRTVTAIEFVEDLTDPRNRAFSPNRDGIKDVLTLTPVIPYPEAVTSWIYALMNSAITTEPVVYVQETGDGSNIPTEIVFDGTASDGSQIPETDLDFEFTVTYKHGNIAQVSLAQLEMNNLRLDNTPPQITLQKGEEGYEKPYTEDTPLIFSPNGDGGKDAARIKIGRNEDVDWAVSLSDSAGTVLYDISSKVTTNLVVWDGKDENGKVMPDGEYFASGVFTDYAGNTSSLERSLMIDVRPVNIVLSYPDGFSPNGDGSVDSFIIKVEKADLFEGVNNWVLAFFDNDRMIAPVYSVSGTSLPDSFTWDGIVTDTQETAGEGTYYFYFSAVYEKGDQIKKTDELQIEYIMPNLTVDNLATNKSQFAMTGTIDDPKSVLTLTIEGKTFPATINGNKWTAAISGIADGTHDVQAVAYDTAGNKGVDYSNNELLIDTSGPVITINRQTVDDPLPVISGSLNEEVSSFSVTIAGKKYSPAVNGKNWSLTVTTPLESGEYDVQASAADKMGNVSTDNTSGELIVDLSGPEIQFEQLATNDTTPDIKGLVNDPKASVTVDVNGKKIQAEVVGGGWSAAVSDEMAPGTYALVIEAVNEIGKRTILNEPEGLIIDITPPVVDVVVTGNPFAQTNEGVEGEVYVSIKVEDDTEVVSWSMDIVEKGKEITPDYTIKSYSGDGDPSGQIAWNGEVKNDPAGKIVEEFTIVINVVDKGGNETSYKEDFPLDIIVVKKDGKLFLMVPNIIFGAYQHTLDSRGPAMEKRNYESIGKVVEIYNRYPLFGLGLEAHALNIYGPGTEKWKTEEQILLPLTERRAESVEKALIDKGITADRIITNAYGGLYPIASTTDSSEWWKNRRVEFIMLPPSGKQQ